MTVASTDGNDPSTREDADRQLAGGSRGRSRTPRVRRPTTTARFGSSRRESHDASGFYDRFVAPEVSQDESVTRPRRLDVIYEGDSRAMGALPDGSVALVVTSPPYFAGKEYEESLGEHGVPGSYFEYLSLLRDVFSECKRVLEPGGRIAVNIANLGRRPYRSLSGDVTAILQELGLLLRGEVVWVKGRAAGGSCAWGTFQRPANPVLRDVTERIVIASKGRFDRALPPAVRAARGLPAVATITRDEFLEATTDLWEIAPESASRVGHPAPFPVELPRRLIELYTYEADIVLDPFMGSGTTAVAALRSGRHYVGYDTDAGYCARARSRLRREVTAPASSGPVRPGGELEDLVATGIAEGILADDLAELVLGRAGFAEIRRDVRLPGRTAEIAYVARDRTGAKWAFELCGAFTTTRAGLRRADVLHRAIGKAAVIKAASPELRIVLLATDVPAERSGAAKALAAVTGEDKVLHDVIELLSSAGAARLASYAASGGAAT